LNSSGRRPNPDKQEEPRVKAVLLAAGLGTRLRPITDSVPKCLLPIAGRRLLDYWFDRLAEANIRDVLINTHHLRENVKVYIDEINRNGLFRVREAYEPKLLGSAGTVSANQDFAEGADLVLIVYADSLSDVSLGQLIQFHIGHGDPVTMMLFHAPRPQDCGIAELDEQGRVIDFVEKPARPKSDLANAGIYVMDAATFCQIADMHAFDLGFEVLPKFIGRMRGWLWHGYHLDVGTREALRRAEAEAPGVFGDREELAK